MMGTKRKAGDDDVICIDAKRARAVEKVTIFDDEPDSFQDSGISVISLEDNDIDSPAENVNTNLSSRFDAAVLIDGAQGCIASEDDNKGKDVIQIDSDDEDNSWLAGIDFDCNKKDDVILIDSEDEDNTWLAEIDIPRNSKEDVILIDSDEDEMLANLDMPCCSKSLSPVCPATSRKSIFVYKTPFFSRFQSNNHVSVPGTIPLSVPIPVPDWTNDGFDDELLRVEMPGDHDDDLLKVLKQRFHLNGFRPNQREIIETTMAGNHCIVAMATGSGKSLCFQLPAVMQPGVTVVIVPLKSLMVDQVDALLKLGICAASVVGGQANQNIYIELHKAQPSIKLVYTTPEMFVTNMSFRNSLKTLYRKGILSRFAIDEAHCISEWGQDFRHMYRKLSIITNTYPKVPVIALTASATKETLNDMQYSLGLKNCTIFKSSVDRPNLRYTVLPKTKQTTQDIVDSIEGEFKDCTGIIYCFSRSECEKMAGVLVKAGISAKVYHAGLSSSLRDLHQREWVQSKINVMVATVAFGMGVDKRDVRFVIHMSAPKSIEGYYQECGRAGRDGKQSHCVLYYSLQDSMKLMEICQDKPKSGIEKYLVNHNDDMKCIDSILAVSRYCENFKLCRRSMIAQHFGETHNTACSGGVSCDNCDKKVRSSNVDVTVVAQQVVQGLSKLVEKSLNIPMGLMVDILKGSKCKQIMDGGHD